MDNRGGVYLGISGIAGFKQRDYQQGVHDPESLHKLML
jgi:hypothetical protein